MQFESTRVRYTISLYWAITTMATVGFGDVTPGTNLERCFAMALQLVAGVLQGVVFGNLGMAMAGFDRNSAEVKARVAETKALARASYMPAALAGRLTAASVAQAEATRGLATEDALCELAGGLLGDAQAATTGARVLAAAPLFCDTRQPLPRGFVNAVARQMRVLALPAGELASSAGDPDGAALLLFRGRCVRVPPKEGSQLDSAYCDETMTEPAVYHAGAMFGDADAVLCRRSAADIFAAKSSTLLAVSRASLDAALEDYPEALAPLTTACLAREAREADAQATLEVTKLVLERCESRKSGHLSAGGDHSRTSTGSGGGSRPSGGAILDAAVPMLASLRSSGVGQAALRGGGSPGASTAAASRRWGKAGAAARAVVRLAGDSRERAVPDVAPDALHGADWSGFNTRLQAVVSAQAAAFDECNARLGAVAREAALCT